MKNLTKIITLFLLYWLPNINYGQLPAKMIQYPDVSDSNICFTYADDLWIVNKRGGTAHRLTTKPGRETMGKFSPDGKTIAFNANYDGNHDIYTIPVTGGIPKRITTHGMSDNIKAWTKDGKFLIYTSRMESGKQRFSKAFKISVNGGLPIRIPISKVEELDLHVNGDLVAMTDKSRLSRNWKRYRGGMASDIYLFNLKTLTSENITNNDGNDELPMWNNDDLYYLSDKDASKKFNIWKYNLQSKEHEQITFFKEFDIERPSIGKSEIVFEAGGTLYLLDVATKTTKEISISAIGDFTGLKPQVKKAEKYIHSVGIAPDGNRIIVGARGDIFSVPKKDGITKNLTRTSGIAERYPSWSPDGRYIAYWSDKTGEYELMVRDLKNNSEKQISKQGPGFRYQLFWSPDSKKLIFVDQKMHIKLANITNNTITKIDQEIQLFQGGLSGFSVSWSNDSKYITYANSHENGNQHIIIYDIDKKKKHTITSAFYDDGSPVFSVDNKYIYCTTNRTFDPVYSDYDNSWTYPNATKIGIIPLTKDAVHPIELKNDKVSINEGDNKKEDTKDKKKEEEKEDQKIKPIRIDFDGIESRMIILPVELGNTGGISAAKGKVIFLKHPRTGSKDEKSVLKYYDFEEDEENTILENVDDYKLSFDNNNILVFSEEKMGIIEVAKDQSLEGHIDTSKMEMTVNPKEEWRQIFTDIWRLERDFFYDKNLHGLDWEAMKKKYEPLIEYAASRNDLNKITGALIAELNASHTYRGGGDVVSSSNKATGYLGVDWEIHQGKYRIKKIITPAPWDTEVKSPLRKPGVVVEEGDYILRINGIELTEYADPYVALEGKANETIEITVSKTPDGKNSKQYLVQPIRSEARLRNLAWIEKMRKYVDEKSGGRIGYIYVPSTGIDGQEELVRMFYAQHHKDGLIIDERFNNGGQIPDRFVELLNRPLLSYYKVREGKDWAWPPRGHYGPKAMLINGWSGSGGDAFPDYFKKRKIGPLIGTRTWGGLIGISGSPELIDGGYVTVPTFRMYNPDGTWFAEGHGVEPDIHVPENPGKDAQGIDVQLDRAINEVLKTLKESDKNPKNKVPAAEDRSK
ncbi:tricorn protease [Aquimarina sp. EL_43]|uniref:S41 family peptidase n=1 Tax=unclassified Aquimarina TaxID=2627091 RepID=UPI0018C8E97C|nr:MULTISPECIES: S41 family peptidase [unclassified Aquimarina]MBG6133104.1 tricorn protease [Aquimarina sp. EL_35]MBG6153262.1 tricorn protease [Aquimarina sp. EL_32]MBG6171469.1 tricorn protease [Aquimarina sp. EL_43]